MYAVIFEVEPASGWRQDYLDIAARLRPDLERIGSSISVERFQGLTEPEKILSLSFSHDEAAVVRWRRHEEHRAARTPTAPAFPRPTACALPRWCATMDG
jgi:heme-degrading monooxygenase HmoA